MNGLLRTSLALCLAGSAATAGPHIFWASDPVQPNETVLVAGSGFGQTPKVWLTTMKDGVRGKPGAEIAWPKRCKELMLKAEQATDESLKFVLPADLKPGSWLFRIEASDGVFSMPARLNCPSVYWFQGDTGRTSASPGGWVRIFGRNVGLPDEKGVVRLKHQQSGKEEDLKPEDVSRWSIRLNLPADLPGGAWDMTVHNGLARERGWSTVGTVTIAPPEQWPDRVFNVAKFGADGMGTVQDGVGIQAALLEAEKAGGGVLYFPRGRYRMDTTLTIPPYTVIRGEETALVSIFWPDTEAPYTLVEGTHHFGIEDVTLYASNYKHVIAGTIRGDETGNTFVRRVRVRADMYRGHLKPDQVNDRLKAALRNSSGGGDTIRLGGPNVEVTDCDLYGSGRSIYLLHPTGARVSGNQFYNGRWGWYCFTGCDGLIYENNTLTGADLMSTGGGINCLGSVYSQNVYYSHNTIRLCHGWDREAMTSDAGGGAYHGPVEAIDGKTIRLPEPGNWRGRDWRRASLYILGGHGMGQGRTIAGVSEDGLTVSLDEPFEVLPDSTSVITVTMTQRNYIFIGNHFEDAGIALQYYGTSVNHIAVGNTSTRSGGFYNSGRWYHAYQPSWFCQFMDNEIIEGNGYRFGANNATGAGDSYLGTYGLQRGENTAPLAYCSVHRRNRLRNNAVLRFIGTSREHPGTRDVVVEHNTVENANTGFYADAGCIGIWERDNTFNNVKNPHYDPEKLRADLKKKRAKLIQSSDAVFDLNFENAETGRAVVDTSGNRFIAAAVNGDVEFVEGLKGKAPRFAGKGYLLVNDNQLLKFETITLSAWVWPDQLKGRWGVIAKRSRGSAAPYVLALRNGAVSFEGTDQSGKWSYNFNSEPVLKPDTWNHIAATCEEGKEVRLYCNGKLVATKAVKGLLVETSDSLTIGFEAWGGADSNSKESGNFRGLIDEVKIWSRILSAEDVSKLYESLKDTAKEDVERRKRESKAKAEHLKTMTKKLASTGGEACGVKWAAVQSEGFDAPTLGKEWVTLRGKWDVKDGTLRCKDVSFLGLATPVKPPVRIEFDARSPHPGDLTAFWGTRRDTYQAGYFMGFASNGNTANKILRLGEEVATSNSPLAVPGKWHHVIAQVLKDRVQLVVDGQLAVEYRDSKPISGADMPGIICWSEGEFDNLCVFTGTPSS